MYLSENKSTVEAKLGLKFRDENTARSILEAVSPDNVQVPEGIDIKTHLKENILKIEISCSKGIGSLILTLDDLLSCIRAAEKTINQLE